MKFKHGKVIMLLFSIMMLLSCNTLEYKENKALSITGVDYDKVVEKGMQSEGLSIEAILFEEQTDNDRIILITAHNALGIAYVSKEKAGWKWERITPLFDWESDSNPLPDYLAGGTDIELPNGRKYFLAMGKIFNPEIVKLTMADDIESTTIVEKYGNIFWFKLLRNKDLFRDIKIYGKDGLEIKD